MHIVDVVIVSAVAFLIGGSLGIALGTMWARGEAVEKDHARYNEKTRKFEWKIIKE